MLNTYFGTSNGKIFEVSVEADLKLPEYKKKALNALRKEGVKQFFFIDWDKKIIDIV